MENTIHPTKKVINPNDPSFVNPENRIGIDRFIRENPENIRLIEETILNNKAVLIDAPTSSGKSKVMGDLFYKWVNYQNRRCYFLLPKIIQQHQFEKTYLKGFPVINADATDDDRELARLCGGSITWQGFLQGNYDDEMTDRDIIIIDEAHLLVNNQSYISETKHLIRKLQRGNYKIVLLTATPNYMAFKALFSPVFLSFYYNDPPPRHIQPKVIDGRILPNIVQYLRSLDFTAEGLHVIRVNDKEKHFELVEWATKSLNLSKDEIQIINRDIADQKFRNADYDYLLENEAIPLQKKLLITTIFSDEGININNQNIKSIAIFYNPKQRMTSQRCRDSVVQFVSRFRYLNGEDRRTPFTIKLFLPELPPDFESFDYQTVLEKQRNTAKWLMHELIETRKNYGRLLVMQSFPMLIDNADILGNLVIEIADGFFQINQQGIYFNTKYVVDQFKSNEQFLDELSPYFQIEELQDYTRKPNLTDSRLLEEVQKDRMKERVEALKILKEKPVEVLHNIAHQVRNPHLQEMLVDLKVDKSAIINGIQGYHPYLMKSVEDEALRISILFQLQYPMEYIAGLLLHKREFRSKMFFLRFLLSRAIHFDRSMDNLYYISLYKPLEQTIDEVTKLFKGKEFLSKADVKRRIRGILPHDLKVKKISANLILDELFVTEEKRITLNGKKATYISIQRRKTLSDIIADFLFINEQHYPTIERVKLLAENLNQKKREHSQKKRQHRRGKNSDNQEESDKTLAQARTEMDKANLNLHLALANDPAFLEKVHEITEAMIRQFKQRVDAIADHFGKVENTDNDIIQMDTINPNINVA